MKHLYRQWRVMRIFNERRHFYHIKVYDDHIRLTEDALNLHERPYTERMFLQSDIAVRNAFWKWLDRRKFRKMEQEIKSGAWGSTLVAHALSDANDKIISCIDDKFIETDLNDSRIRITNEGIKFSSVFGLLVEFRRRFGGTLLFLFGVLGTIVATGFFGGAFYLLKEFGAWLLGGLGLA